MTSKEDLKTLLEYFYYQGKTPIIPKEQVEFILNNLEKDLEVLEILKKHLIINSWDEIVYVPKHHCQYINGEECKLFKPNEEDTKIKEWLN